MRVDWLDAIPLQPERRSRRATDRRRWRRSKLLRVLDVRLRRGGECSARVAHFEPDKIRITSKAAADGLLVVSEIYETGWRAYVDGELVDIIPTNYVMGGVPIPAGEHVIELRYELPSLQIGLVITGIFTIAMLLAFGYALWSYVHWIRATRSGSGGMASAASVDGRGKGGNHEHAY